MLLIQKQWKVREMWVEQLMVTLFKCAKAKLAKLANVEAVN